LSGKPSIMQEIRDLETMRGIISGVNFPFKAAFDLNTRKIYFYIEKNYHNAPKYKEVSTKGMYDYIYRDYKDVNGEKVFFLYDDVKLNKDFTYVFNNIMRIDNNEQTLNIDSIMPD
jgi:hypothetical protein